MILVQPNGRAGEIKVETSSGYPELDQRAVETAKGYDYVPAKRGDTPVAGYARQSFKFSLSN